MDSDCPMFEASGSNPGSVVGLVEDDDSSPQVKYEEKKAQVEEEIRRMNQLPSRSAYAAHRMRVLSKVLQLLCVQQRSAAEEAQLEDLFAKLSL
uniref:Uncharacterized protein n=1 Tax=Kalanchoe fedtschenkoi TaxID=63787 RepID=A0A7N0VEH2_KALFE